MYKLRDWIPLEKVYWFNMSKNPSDGAMDLLEKNPDKIDWYSLSSNTSERAICLLEKNTDKISWYSLSSNTSERAICLLEKNPDKISWYRLARNSSESAFRILEKHPELFTRSDLSYEDNTSKWAIRILEKRLLVDIDDIDWDLLCKNPAAIDILEKHTERINGYYFSLNPSKRAILLLENNQDRIDWVNLSSNPAAKNLFENNRDKIDWRSLSFNPADWAIELLKQNLDKVFWYGLCQNPSARAIQLLEENQDKIPDLFIDPTIQFGRNQFFSNPAIFVYDYARMRAVPMGNASLHAEFVAWWFSPARVAAFLEEVGGDIDKLDEM